MDVALDMLASVMESLELVMVLDSVASDMEEDTVGSTHTDTDTETVGTSAMVDVIVTIRKCLTLLIYVFEC